MNIKRKVLATILSVICIACFCGIQALAAVSYDLSAKNLDITTHGYLDFLEGSSVYQDRVWYNGGLWGTDVNTANVPSNHSVDAASCYIHVQVKKWNDKDKDQKIDNGELETKYNDKQYLYPGRQVYNGPSNGAACGYGNYIAYEKINCLGLNKTISMN